MSTTTNSRQFHPFEPTPEQHKGIAFARPHKRTLEHGLSQEQLDSFWKNGFISLPGLFSENEAEAFQNEAELLYNDPHVNENNMRYDFSKGKTEPILWKIDPFHDRSDLFKSMVVDRRICDVLASIYEGREPRLFKDKLIYKPPHTKGNGLHQDYTWWQGFPISLISVAISVDAANEDNGCTMVYPGFEKGLLEEPGTFDFLSRDKIDESRQVKNVTKPGDVLFFHCYAPHEAGANNTDGFRRQIFLTYNDAADGEHYKEHYEHFGWYSLKNSRLSQEEKKMRFFV